MRNAFLLACLISIPYTATAQSVPIYGDPTGGQVITQPVVGGTQTTFTVNSIATGTLNQVFYVDPTSSTDLITQVNALISACGSAPCTIRIPAMPTGSYSVTSGTINITSTGISLIGDGVGSTVINYSGSNFINWYVGGCLVPAGKVAGFSLSCSAPNSNCIQVGSVIGADLEDLVIYGPGLETNSAPCANSTGILFQNNPENWTERWLIRHVEIGGFCVNVHFTSPPGPSTSYGYGLMDGLWTNQGAGFQGGPSYGVEVDSGADVYNALGWKYQFNLGTLFYLTSATDASGGETTYACQAPLFCDGGTSNAFVGDKFAVSGFTNAGNNGTTFICTASTATTITLANSGGVAETVPPYTASAGALGAEVFHVAGTLGGVGFHVTGENGGGPMVFAHIPWGGNMRFEGDYNTFAGGVEVDPSPFPDPAPASPLFFIGPFAGLGGVLGGTAAATPSIPNFGGSGQTVDAYPVQSFGGSSPEFSAQLGYVVSHTPNFNNTPPTAPFFVYDPYVPFCYGYLEGSTSGTPISEAIPNFCVSGPAGDVTTPGSGVFGDLATSYTQIQPGILSVGRNGSGSQIFQFNGQRA